MARQTRQVWAKQVERWIDSGLTAKEFAAEIGVNPNTLAGWRWRLGQDAAPPAPGASGSAAPPFVELIGATAAGEASATEAAGVEPRHLPWPPRLFISDRSSQHSGRHAVFQGYREAGICAGP
jgi:transposase-like protein